jgi:hypothetical protein
MGVEFHLELIAAGWPSVRGCYADEMPTPDELTGREP